jgi:HEAT repeat protein/beta-lactamase regulating signal transducer with metallopeptidase domain
MTAIHVLGWTLVHFLWQGALVAAALGLAFALTRRAAPTTRYALGLAALGVMLVLPFGTALRLTQQSSTAGGEHAPSIVTLGVPDNEPDVAPPDPRTGRGDAVPTSRTGSIAAAVFGTPEQAHELLQRWIPWIVGLWLVGVVGLSARLLGGLAHVRRLAQSVSEPVPDACRRIVEALIDRLGITRGVRIVVTHGVSIPGVVGWVRPVLLLPVSVVTGFTTEQLEVLIAHELAHIRRHDYLVNLVQTVVDTLLFYHPAVWWVSRRVREEREHCCDDVAVRVNGDSRLYATALLELETARAPWLRLMPAAAGGQLLRRIRRLLAHEPAPADLGPRWMAGLVTVVVALVAVTGAQLSGTSLGAEGPGAKQPPFGDTTQVEPDTVIHYAGTDAMDGRWTWAGQAARRSGFDRYWVGYVVPAPAGVTAWHYFDRDVPLRAGRSTISGHIRFTGRFARAQFSGVTLAEYVESRPPQDLVLLLGFDRDGGGARLARIHLSNFVFPVHFRGLPLIWLGPGSDAESVALLARLFETAPAGAEWLREDLVAMVGAHNDADAVVPALVEWLEGSEPSDVREHAAEWLGYHPDPRALAALTRAARSDRSTTVRAESVEAIGDQPLAEATDTLINIVRDLPDVSVRREATEALAQRQDDRVIAVLVDLARSDPSPDIQLEAVETLGDLSGRRGVPALMELLRTHPSPDIRREVVETLGDAADSAEMVELMARIAREDRHEDVQREAIETLGELDDPRVQAILIELVNSLNRTDLQREAVETLADVGAAPQVLEPLTRIAQSHPRTEVRVEAVETLGEIDDSRVPALLDEIVRGNAPEEVQVEAVETLGDVHAGDVLAVLRAIANDHPRVRVQIEAVETLSEVRDDAVIDVLIEIARGHPRAEVRREAVEALADRASPDLWIREP